MIKKSCFKLFSCSLLLVLYFFDSILGQSRSSDYEEYEFIDELPGYYCGSKLDKTLDEVCSGQFAHKISYPPEMETETKAKVVSTTVKPQLTRVQKLLKALQPLKSMDAFKLLLIDSELRRNRNKRGIRSFGIYDECCRHPCSKMTLREYCLY